MKTVEASSNVIENCTAVGCTEMRYAIDWDRVQSIDDIKRILKPFNITFDNDPAVIEPIADLVRLEPTPVLPSDYWTKSPGIEISSRENPEWYAPTAIPPNSGKDVPA